LQVSDFRQSVLPRFDNHARESKRPAGNTSLFPADVKAWAVTTLLPAGLQELGCTAVEAEVCAQDSLWAGVLALEAEDAFR
jgi:hypothetical protein